MMIRKDQRIIISYFICSIRDDLAFDLFITKFVLKLFVIFSKNNIPARTRNV